MVSGELVLVVEPFCDYIRYPCPPLSPRVWPLPVPIKADGMTIGEQAVIGTDARKAFAFAFACVGGGGDGEDTYDNL